MSRTGRIGEMDIVGQPLQGRTAAIVSVLALALIVSLHAQGATFDVYAVRFATIANFRVSSLVAGADPNRRLDIAMMIWVLKARTAASQSSIPGFIASSISRSSQ